MTGSKIYIDTAPFIYYLEQNAQYYQTTRQFFMNCYAENKNLVTSAVTIEEFCVYPLSLGDSKAIENFNAFLNGMGIQIVSVDRIVAFKASELRSKYEGIKALDALHLASAIISGCTIFLTNDKQLRQVREIKVIVMDEIETLL